MLVLLFFFFVFALPAVAAIVCHRLRWLHSATTASTNPPPQLLKLMVHELECLDGIVRRHPHLRIARFHQHLTDLLDPELTPLECAQSSSSSRCSPDLCLRYIIKEFSPMEPTVARSQIGRFGITGDAQTAQMKNLSDGQKSRVSKLQRRWLLLRCDGL